MYLCILTSVTGYEANSVATLFFAALVWDEDAVFDDVPFKDSWADGNICCPPSGVTVMESIIGRSIWPNGLKKNKNGDIWNNYLINSFTI